MTETPKPKQARRRKPKEQPEVTKPIEVEDQNPHDWSPEDEYNRNSQQDGPYKPPEHMVNPPDPERYLKKDRIGKQKSVRSPGTKVERVGLGGLTVIHSNPIDYYGNLDV